MDLCKKNLAPGYEILDQSRGAGAVSMFVFSCFFVEFDGQQIFLPYRQRTSFVLGKYRSSPRFHEASVAHTNSQFERVADFGREGTASNRLSEYCMDFEANIKTRR